MRQAAMCRFVAIWLLVPIPASAQVERAWLSHRSEDPSRLVVSWTTVQPGDSVVEFGLTPEYGQSVRVEEQTTLHHVEIPLDKKDAIYHYRVSTGEQRSADATYKAYPTDQLRVAVVANWQGRPDLSAVIADDVHLLLTAGDNISNIHGPCEPGEKDCIRPYAALVDAYPELFRSTPFMPVLGNHDKEIRPRGSEPPAEPVYDIDATAFRRFFELPGDEWKWRFDVPEFGVRFVAFDLNHLSDFGTTWQSCHAFEKDSPQYAWGREAIGECGFPFVVSLFNEKSSTVRRLEDGAWGEMLAQGTMAITGFGHFAERAVTDGFPWYNTSLQGRGNRYPDPASAVLESRDNYLLLTFDRGAGVVTVELKDLAGNVIDRRESAGRAQPLSRWKSGVKIAPVLGEADCHSIHTYYLASPESPDGRWVLLYRSTEEDAHVGDVVIVERATGKVKTLASEVVVEDSHRVACQQWIRGGREVLFHDLREGEWRIIAVDIDSGEERELARGRQLGWGQPHGDTVPLYGPHWAPGERRDLELLHVPSGEIRTVLTAVEVKKAYPAWVAEQFQQRPISVFFPVLSPDETRVFFKVAAPAGGGFRSRQGSDRHGLVTYDLVQQRLASMHPKWVHPAWHPDSRRILNLWGSRPVLIDSDTAEGETYEEFPQFRGGHPAMAPDGRLFVTDAYLDATDDSPRLWGVVAGDLAAGEHVWIDRFENSRGATSWRPCHPHPVFSADGRRIYYNVSAGSRTRLYVAEARREE